MSAIDGLNQFQSQGFATLAEASERFSRQTIEANVRTSAEKNLKAKVNDLSNEKARAESKVQELQQDILEISRENSELRSDNDKLQQELEDAEYTSEYSPQDESNDAEDDEYTSEYSPQENSNSDPVETRHELDQRLARAREGSSFNVRYESNSTSSAYPTSGEVPVNTSNNIPEDVIDKSGIDLKA
ncbi:MAG: hypothetical protein HQL46_00350 [Gammaproteobacteria bacterium]|nr:hypothetical protein [Gammaproteobacteria bacterium]